jgi:hypothetical protein
MMGCMKSPDPSLAGSSRPGDNPHGPMQGAPAIPDTGAAGSESGTEGGGMELAFAAPSGWQSTQGGNAFTVAKWTLAEGGQCTVTAVGGDTQSNFRRWEQQFEVSPGGELKTVSVPDSRYPATMCTIYGTLNSTQQLGGGPPREGWMLLGFSLPDTPSGPLYVKVLGSVAVLAPQIEEIKAAVAQLEIR